MPNMLDYARSYAQEPFSAVPLGPIDGVLLSQLAYFDFAQLPVTSGTCTPWIKALSSPP